MKRILLLCIGIMSLTSNATSISNVMKEHKLTSYSCAIASITYTYARISQDEYRTNKNKFLRRRNACIMGSLGLAGLGIFTYLNNK